MDKSKIISWDDDNQYSLVTGGLIYLIMSKLKFYAQTKKGLLKTALFFLLLAWLPLLLLSIIEGNFVGEKVVISFSEDFLIQIQLLIIIPFLIIIEKAIDSSFDDYVNTMRRLVGTVDESKFEKLTQRLDKLSNSIIPEIIFLIIIYGLVIIISEEALPQHTEWSYLLDSDGIKFTLSGWYLLLISMPIYQLLLFRWMWRWFLWVYSSFIFSRLNLNINAMHADQMAGLEFLNVLPLWFGFLALSLSTVFSAQTGMEIVYQNASLQDYVYPIAGYVVVITMILYLPLIFFMPALLKAKTNGIYYYGGLATYHNNLFRTKWLKGELPKEESSLGSLDNSSLADLNSGYQQSVGGMNVIPINFRRMMGTALGLLVPFLPLLGTYYSLPEFLSKLAEIVFG